MNNFYIVTKKFMFNRILSNTHTQIIRGGWTAWASISVMTLAFLVASIFGGLAYVSNLYIQYIETKSNLLVFFNEGMDQETINRLWGKWSHDSRIKNVSFITEDQAYKDYGDYTSKVQPEIYSALKAQKNKILPSSLDIQIWSLKDLNEIKVDLNRDIEAELENLKIIHTAPSATDKTTTNGSATGDTTASQSLTYKYTDDDSDRPIKLKVDDKSLDQLRQVLFSLRVAGLGIITLLFIVIFFFTFMTVEFRLYNQMEEIGVMQLVGGSLFFIRAPYILEGGFYGFIGSLVSSLIIGSIITTVFILDKSSVLASFIYKNFSKLPWPYITPLGWGVIIFSLAVIGFMLGAVSSYISIKRYIR